MISRTPIFAVALLAGLLFNTPSAYAQDAEPFDQLCAPYDTVVYFGNGIRTILPGAERGRIKLEAALREVIDEEAWERISFDIAYNPTGGTLRDLLESSRQDIGTDLEGFLRRFFELVPLEPEWLDDYLEELAQKSAAAGIVNTDSLARHVRLYKRSIGEGKKVMLVAHSQGTFYANQAYGALTAEERESFGLASVAAMDSFIAGGNSHFTVFNDLVVDAVRLAKAAVNLPGPPDSNILQLPRSVIGHDFAKEYLASGSPARTSISSNVAAQIEALSTPDAELEEGVITVTLTWGSEPDVDLHVFEPSGFQVYYRQRQGQVGFIDVDDTSSFGPEHYYVDCADLTTGTFRVGVNYYRGSGPETAKVDVQAGLVERSFTQGLGEALGSTGDSMPIPVADIVVTGDETTGFIFEVQGR